MLTDQLGIMQFREVLSLCRQRTRFFRKKLTFILHGAFISAYKIDRRMTSRRRRRSRTCLADHVHELDAGEYRVGRFEVDHWPRNPLNYAFMLFNDVVEVCDLAHDNRDFSAGVECIDSRFLGAAFCIATLSELAFPPKVLSKMRFAAAISRLAVSRKVDGLDPACLQRVRGISRRT